MPVVSSERGAHANSVAPPVPLFDLHAQHIGLADSLREAFQRVLSRSSFILGAEVAEFERTCTHTLGVPHAVGVSSGSDALLLALLAAGVRPSDEVITTPFTFTATAEAILRAGAAPVFADIDAGSLCLSAESVEKMLSARTRAVLFVHLYGNPSHIEAIADLCARKGLLLIEDACQAFGARVAGRAAGCFGDVGCFSFFPTKPLGAMGDGGLCVTPSRQVYEALRSLRVHGIDSDESVAQLGGNYRLDALQAAVLSAKLPCVEGWREQRARHAEHYIDALRSCPRIVPLLPPQASVRHAWALTTWRIRGGRDELKTQLSRRGIDSKAYYPKLLPDHAIFRECRRAELTQARNACGEVLSVPNYSGMSAEIRDRVIGEVVAWARNSK